MSDNDLEDGEIPEELEDISDCSLSEILSIEGETIFLVFRTPAIIYLKPIAITLILLPVQISTMIVIPNCCAKRR